MSAEPRAPEIVPLDQLSGAWMRFGCAICAQVPSPHAPPGMRIELHHILPRSQGGTDEAANLMGLCGEMCENKCHWKVTTNRTKIRWAQNVGGWVWSDQHGITGICRPLDQSLIEEAGQGESLVLSTEVLTRKTAAVVPDEWVPEDFVRGFGKQAAEQRFMMIREAHQDLEQRWLRLALLVQYSLSQSDHAQLGFSTVKEWADAIGIGVIQMSKLRLVGKVFQGSWVDLPKADQAMLSMEGMYIAARMVKTGRWQREFALHEAVAQPISYLLSIYTTKNALDYCECPKCGRQHFVPYDKSSDQKEKPPLT